MRSVASETGPVRVVVVAGIRFYRDGIADALADAPRTEIAGRAASAEEALAIARMQSPDLALVDVVVEDGLALISALRIACPNLRIVALGVEEVESEIMPLVEAGVAGYVTRESSLDDLATCVRTVAAGETLCSPRMVATFLSRIATLSTHRHAVGDAVPLTSREVEIVRLIDRGLSNKQIARELCIELPTVKNHVHHILEKLHVTRRAEAAAKMRGVPQVSRSGSA